MELTHLIVTKNNEKTIQKTLNSLSNNVLVYDLGSKDQTINILKKNNIKYEITELNKKEARNKLTDEAETDWVFHIEPWEILNIEPESHGLVKIFKNNLISKEIRIWNKKNTNLKFDNPLYPKIPLQINEDSGGVLYALEHQMSFGEGLDTLNKWEKQFPLDHQIPYYKAFFYLEHKKYDEFIRFAEEYLHHSGLGPEAIHLKYYLALIYFHYKSNYKYSMEKIMECIVVNPDMSEYWCLGGDIYYKLMKFNKAKSFYENALIIGKIRQDEFRPIEIEKYKEYPNKMIEECMKIINTFNDK
jgi:hypothetical protein